MEMVQLNCCHCGNEYLKPARLVKRDQEKQGRKHYCSKKCFYEAYTTKLSLVCLKCGRTFVRKKSEVRFSKTFCSRTCANVYTAIGRDTKGKNHPSYTNGKSSYRNIIDNKSKCHYCDYNDIRILIVHHIDKNRNNNNEENLLIVCPTHHMELHREIKQFT
jgi:hypothetical protein